MLRATLSVDHRAIDGSVGAAFLQTLQGILGQPELLSDAMGSS
jgi:pyruvate/2-oxoglutarate dehydrogenase complex dihydrolipoamide acyltransferase (E2) component